MVVLDDGGKAKTKNRELPQHHTCADQKWGFVVGCLGNSGLIYNEIKRLNPFKKVDVIGSSGKIKIF